MKKYETPEMEIVVLSGADIITTSGYIDENEEDSF